MTDDLKAVLTRISDRMEADRALRPPEPEPDPAEIERHRAEALEYAWRCAAKGIGVPTRLVDASFRHGAQNAALQRAQHYVESGDAEQHCLLLMGPTGVGKTYAAVAILRAMRGRARRFWYFPGLCGALLDPERRAETLEAVKDTQLVVLDDFGAEYLKAGGLLDAFIDEIIWHREAEMLPTVITTNLLPDQLRERLSDRIVDRLKGEWGRLYAVPGQSMRVRA